MVPQFLDPKGKKICIQKIFGPKNLGVIVQINVGPQQLKPKKHGSKKLVKIVSVTAEIMLIWTNVARTYVA